MKGVRKRLNILWEKASPKNKIMSQKQTLTFEIISDLKRLLQWSPVRPGNVTAIRAHSKKKKLEKWPQCSERRSRQCKPFPISLTPFRSFSSSSSVQGESFTFSSRILTHLKSTFNEQLRPVTLSGKFPASNAITRFPKTNNQRSQTDF